GRVGVAVPLPGVDAVGPDLALHLLEQLGEVGGVPGAIPVMVGGAVALAERPLRAGDVVDLLLALAHDPARQRLPGEPRRAGRLREDRAIRPAVDLLAGYPGDHGHAGLAVEVDLLDVVRERVRIRAPLEPETHAADELGVAKPEGEAVGEVALDVDDEV